MNILVINAGSSSLKCSLFVDKSGDLIPIWKGQIDWSDSSSHTLHVEAVGRPKLHKELDKKDHVLAAKILLEQLWSGNTATISGPDVIDIIGHRIVHGGTKYCSPTLVSKEVLADLHKFIELAPVHEPVNIQGIEITAEIFKGKPQIAVFDTAFFHKMPESAIVYPGPYEWYEKHNIRRFGFHGISHEFCAGRAAELLEKDPGSLRIITCHLGNGASLAAIKNGACLATTMGFTPLEGLMMGNRSGSIDPGLIFYFLEQKIYSATELQHVLNYQSGLKGISGLSKDMRIIEKEMAAGNHQAKLAFDLYVRSLSMHIASLLPILGGLDVLVFAGGIGENSAQVRAAACEQLACLGITIETDKNIHCTPDADISSASTSIKTLVIQTKEDLAIAQACLPFIK